MRTLDAESVDAIVSDPPYGLSFMGKEWDHGVPGEPFWREALRVAKPGAHLVAFGGTRTYHRLACAIEDAGWEIRDCLSWLYGSGFPKSLDVSKAMDKAQGAEREVTGVRKVSPSDLGQNSGWNPLDTSSGEYQYTAPATDLARQWQGWGTALKPAWEPIILARKPLTGTVAANVAQYGTGALNIDGCRIGTDIVRSSGSTGMDARRFAHGTRPTDYASRREPSEHAGRWPANVVLDEAAAAMLDAQTGRLKSGVAVRHKSGGNTFGGGAPKPPMDDLGYGDSGGASRFFYTAKASRREREAGLEGMPERLSAKYANGDGLSERTMVDGEWRNTEAERKPARNVHPTVKPIALMRWLCRLVTPPNGLILDPFCGSGSTGCAAVLEGFRFTGIEREAEYVEIANRRIAHWAKHREQDAEPSLFCEIG